MTASTATSTALHPADLNLFHRNPRVGNVAVIAGSLRANGQYKPLVVNKGTHTGRPNEVLAGNHTLKAIRDLAEQYPDDERWQTVLVHMIDVDDDRATRIVAADNRTSEVGTMNDEVLLELLEGLGDDLDGTGYSDEDLADLVALAEETADAADDAPPAAPPRTGEDGLIEQKDITTLSEEYGDRATRMVILTYAVDRFIWVQETLARYREEHSLDTNTDAVRHLLEQWSGEEAPAVDEDEDEDAL